MAVPIASLPPRKKTKKPEKILAFELIMLIFVLNYNKNDDMFVYSKLIKSI